MSVRVYKVEIYNRRLNDSKVERNIKKLNVGSTQGTFKKKDIKIMKVVSHSKYIDKELV